MKNHRLSALATLIVAACSSTVQQSRPSGEPAQTPAEMAKADSGVPAYTRADVAFMQGMIHHHAQAVVMAGWAPTHGARESVRLLAARIDVAQRDEINFMQHWLRDRHETVPQIDSQQNMTGMAMPGMQMPALMPGMLTPAQMAQLSAASGPEFDRLFLTFMIQHHTGALTMVQQLFSSTGAAQDGLIFRFANDVGVDQTTEINRMRIMLAPPTP